MPQGESERFRKVISWSSRDSNLGSSSSYLNRYTDYSIIAEWRNYYELLAGKDMEEYYGDQLLLQPFYNEHRFEEPQSKYESGDQEK